MTGRRPKRIAVFGLGEAGSLIAAGLAAAGADVTGYDPADVPTPTKVTRHKTPSEAVVGAGLIMSITAATDARSAIDQACNDLPRGAIYADLSTATPALKGDLSETATHRGLRFVDVALMEAVPGRGVSTPSLASGPEAHDFASIVNDLGGDVEVVGETPGVAATMKLLRSIVTKGLTGVTLEAMEAASRFGLEDWLWDHVGEFLETADRRTIERLVAGTRPHVNRRIVEMSSAAELLESVSIQPLTARATEALLKNLREGRMPATDRRFHEE